MISWLSDQFLGCLCCTHYPPVSHLEALLIYWSSVGESTMCVLTSHQSFGPIHFLAPIGVLTLYGTLPFVIWMLSWLSSRLWEGCNTFIQVTFSTEWDYLQSISVVMNSPTFWNIFIIPNQVLYIPSSRTLQCFDACVPSWDLLLHVVTLRLCVMVHTDHPPDRSLSNQGDEPLEMPR